ncbi:MAG: 4-(cytidine 5'-diphospho)-2-C-methyl-D-erythritol kinase [Candidatus Gracilibacteria bacterium]
MTTLTCPAKVNLYLAILGRDPSGYHLIDTVFVRVPEPADTLEIELAKEFMFECETLSAEKNSVMKAVRLLEQKSGRKFLYHIRLTKNIPMQSGLGGGSSDAAALLLYLNRQENLGFTREQLMELGAQIGMDVPFFLSGYEVARGTHYGEKITPLPSLPPSFHIDIGFTNIPVSTKGAFATWDKRGLQSTAPTFSNDITNNIHNDFEQIFPDLSFKKINTVLSGSGGAYAILTSVKA